MKTTKTRSQAEKNEHALRMLITDLDCIARGSMCSRWFPWRSLNRLRMAVFLAAGVASNEDVSRKYCKMSMSKSILL